MAHESQPHLPAKLHNRHLSADFIPRTKEPSMLYSMLPSAIKSRLPRLPSLRRSVSMYGLPTRRKSADSRPSSGARTPEYTFAMVLAGGQLADQDDMGGFYPESLSNSSDDDLAPASSGKSRRTTGMELTENRSGIGWKFANQGTSPSAVPARLTRESRSQPPQSCSRRVLHPIPRPTIRKREFCSTGLPPCPHVPSSSPAI